MKNLPKNIFLVGSMGAGKSSIGKRLAKLIGFDFFDSDREVEKRSGVDIVWIFEVEKEEGFRKREEIVIEELAHRHGVVLSTGGGTIVREINRRHLKENGVVIYLTVSFEQQVERTSRRHGLRPMIEGPSLHEKLDALNKEREPLYQSIADFTYRTDNCSPQELCQKIIRDLGIKIIK